MSVASLRVPDPQYLSGPHDGKRLYARYVAVFVIDSLQGDPDGDEDMSTKLAKDEVRQIENIIRRKVATCELESMEILGTEWA